MNNSRRGYRRYTSQAAGAMVAMGARDLYRSVKKSFTGPSRATPANVNRYSSSKTYSSKGSTSLPTKAQERKWVESISTTETSYLNLDISLVGVFNSGWGAGAPGALSGNAFARQLDVVTTGTATNQRQGDRWKPETVQIRFYCAGPAELALPELCECLLVWDRTPTESIVSTGAVITVCPSPQFVLTSNEPTSLANREYTDRFKILRRYPFVLDPTTTTSYLFTDYVTLPKSYISRTSRNDTNGQIGGRQEGALYFYFLTQGGTMSRIDLNTRVYFRDD